MQWLGHRARRPGGELAKVYVSSMVADLTGERRAVLDWLRLARRQAVDSYLPDSDSILWACGHRVQAGGLHRASGLNLLHR